MRHLVLILAALLSLPAGPAPAQEARLMILHDHGNPVVSEMVRLRIRGEYDLTVSLEDMQFPNSPDYDWMQIARDDWHKERVNGRLRQVFERQVALFPRRVGPLQVGPVSHRLTYVTPDDGRAEIEVVAPPVTLNVKAFPGGYTPLAASRLTLTDELSAQPGSLKKDEILTRRVTVEALGALAHSLPPRPDLRQPWMISFTVPETRETVLTAQGPVARVVWEWQMRPQTGEPAILPGTGFPWFDTDSRQIEVAPLRPIPFGFAGFGSNFGDAGAAGARNGLIAAVALAAGVLAGMTLLARHRGMLPPTRLRGLWRRLRPSPHRAALRAAAARGDLGALRRAAEAHLRWLGLPVTGLQALDRQIYAESPPAGFDARHWLRGFLRDARRMPQPAATAACQRAP
ncbi:hypothetical protein [Paracoccus spongiarum]|uniref:Protein BatD n=1 Tax=Paracoccus spongiarum TaxID=3064387 RepID=A0ABT9JBX2_9RHOB|nr:hypothetical protein [Paracoccus sp. 2205BS29-5]MDP5306616.1 hypothetical protein [Paracoccus sp. 2205BS29-5]